MRTNRILSGFIQVKNVETRKIRNSFLFLIKTSVSLALREIAAKGA